MTKGIKFTYLIITLNLLIACLMVVFLFGGVPDLTSLISEWPLNLGVGIFGLYLSGYFIGKWMETRICKRK